MGTLNDALQYGQRHFLPACSSRTFSDLLQWGHFNLKYMIESNSSGEGDSQPVTHDLAAEQAREGQPAMHNLSEEQARAAQPVRSLHTHLIAGDLQATRDAGRGTGWSQSTPLACPTRRRPN